MKQGVTIDEMARIVDARLWLLNAQQWLWLARVGKVPGPIQQHEDFVKKCLDRLWEVQQRAA